MSSNKVDSKKSQNNLNLFSDGPCFRGDDIPNEGVFVHSIKPKGFLLSWECPVCNIGVRGGIDVCPNCVRRNLLIQAGDTNQSDFAINIFVQEGEDER